METEYNPKPRWNDYLSHYASPLGDKDKMLAAYFPELSILYEKKKEYTGKNSDNDMLEGLVKENQTLKQSSLNQILNLIAERIKERDHLINELDKEICNIHTKQFQLNDAYSEVNRKLTISLDQVAARLEVEKAKERINAWQDITKLRRDLIPVLTEYLTSVRKSELLGIVEEKEPDYLLNRKVKPVYILPPRIP